MEGKRTSYYAWVRRGECQRAKENRALLHEIIQIHSEYKRRYGAPKIYEELKIRGRTCGHNRVARLMRENNIRAKFIKKYRHKGKCVTDSLAAPNIVDRKFNPENKNMIWAMDLTYIWTKTGWTYLCICMDLFNKSIIGWSLSKRAKADTLIEALKKAIKSRSPGRGLVVHSDRGSQFGSNGFRQILKRHHFVQSMSRKGNCWDNACVESFFARLKTECIYDFNFDNILEVRWELFKYIDIFYNRKRIHSTLGYMTPLSYEKMNIKNA